MEPNTALDQQPPRRQLHTVKDVCRGARISAPTAWRLIGRGILETVKIGTATRITDASYQRLVTQGTPKVAAE
jgi:hypothetical protein